MRVYASAVFDLFHYGHVRFLKKCKTLHPNVHLIIGLHNDKDTEKYKRKPIMTQDERYISLLESNLVDEIIQNAPIYETKEFYKIHNIELVVHAHSPEENKFYRDTCCKHAHEMGIFKRLDYQSGISTTELINRIKNK